MACLVEVGGVGSQPEELDVVELRAGVVLNRVRVHESSGVGEACQWACRLSDSHR